MTIRKREKLFKYILLSLIVVISGILILIIYRISPSIFFDIKCKNCIKKFISLIKKDDYKHALQLVEVNSILYESIKRSEKNEKFCNIKDYIKAFDWETAKYNSYQSLLYDSRDKYVVWVNVMGIKTQRKYNIEFYFTIKNSIVKLDQISFPSYSDYLDF